MADFYEIDFLAVETKKSGDAISIRYEVNGVQYIHVVDGGYLETGTRLVQSINDHYGRPRRIDHVIATHPDGDHTVGLRTVLESFEVGTLWMLRPWRYAEELIARFPTYTDVNRLRSRLRNLYPNLAALEDIALARRIPIAEPFQGSQIGAFRVLAPSKHRYFDCIVNSERTPESVEEAAQSTLGGILGALAEQSKKALAIVRGPWGYEAFSPEEAGAENEMSVVQFARLNDHKILLTGDAGRSGLLEAAEYAPFVGLALPGIDKFQVPHHGSRRNVSTELLDRWLGQRLPRRPEAALFTAFISSAKEDMDHPRKAVVRALIHRGAKVIATEGVSTRSNVGAPERPGWSAASHMDYPEELEA